jgi:hypothetical protein
MTARIGSMIAPFVAAGLNETAHWLPPVIFGAIPIIGAVLVLFLPGEKLNYCGFQNLISQLVAT